MVNPGGVVISRGSDPILLLGFSKELLLSTGNREDSKYSPFEAGPALGAVLFKELVEDEPLAEVVEVLAKGGNLSAESPAVRRLCLEL